MNYVLSWVSTECTIYKISETIKTEKLRYTFICSNYTPIILLSHPKSSFKISKQNLSIPFLRLGKQQKPETVWKVVFNNIKWNGNVVMYK